MSALLSCNPAWAPFEDPDPDVQQLLDAMTARINQEEIHTQLNAIEFERKRTHQRRFLELNGYDLEAALKMWHDWVKWRHELGVNEITEEDIAHERAEGIAKWQGRNKAGMKCCVVTARNLDPINRSGTARSFKRYIIKIVEEALQEIDDDEEDRICVIYDRRGMTFSNIDPNLYSFCKKLMEDMRWFYAHRVGVIYIMHLNLVFWALYYVFVYPTVGLVSRDFHKRFVIVDKPEDLLKYFNAEDLFVLREDVAADESNATTTAEVLATTTTTTATTTPPAGSYSSSDSSSSSSSSSSEIGKIKQPQLQTQGEKSGSSSSGSISHKDESIATVSATVVSTTLSTVAIEATGETVESTSVTVESNKGWLW